MLNNSKLPTLTLLDSEKSRILDCRPYCNVRLQPNHVIWACPFTLGLTELDQIRTEEVNQILASNLENNCRSLNCRPRFNPSHCLPQWDRNPSPRWHNDWKATAVWCQAQRCRVWRLCWNQCQKWNGREPGKPHTNSNALPPQLTTGHMTDWARQTLHTQMSLPSELTHTSIFSSIACHIHLPTRAISTYGRTATRSWLYFKVPIVRCVSVLECTTFPYIQSSQRSSPVLVNLVDQFLLCPSRKNCIQSSIKLCLKSAFSQPIHIESIIRLVALFGDLHTHVTS